MVEAFFENFVLKLEDAYALAQERETFLNVDEKLYQRLFYFILILKCVIAGYGVKKVVPANVTFSVLWLNFINSCICDGKFEGVVFNFAFLAATAGSQLLFIHDRFPVIFSAISWTIASVDKCFHFALDFYVIVTLLSYILIEHSKNIGEACLLMCHLFFVDWFCSQFIEEMVLLQSLALFYLPVFFVTSFKPFDRRTFRFACAVILGLLWLFYKLVRAEMVTFDVISQIILQEKLEEFLRYIEMLNA